jgi:hypothetical protein
MTALLFLGAVVYQKIIGFVPCVEKERYVGGFFLLKKAGFCDT